MWSEFLFSYGLFIAKIVTGLIALIFVVGILSGLRQREREDGTNLKVINLNKKFQDLKDAIEQSLLDKKAYKKLAKSKAKEEKGKQKKDTNTQPRPRMFVLEFDGDIKASGVDSMRDEITAVLAVAEPQDEVLLKLDNSGGMVHEHGLAASQLQRIKDAKLTFTVSIDRVAASGGYLMACVADKIIAAPFAIIGSIGVLAQLPNFNRLLDRAGIDFEQHTAGEFKRTVTMFGENTDKERKKLQEELQETHLLFRDFVSEHRSKLDVDRVATGEHWYGKQALELNLVDELKTSDELLLQAFESFDLYQVQMEAKKTIQDRILGGLFSAFGKLKLGIAGSEVNSSHR